MRVRVRGRSVQGRGFPVRGGGVVRRAQVSEEIQATVINHALRCSQIRIFLGTSMTTIDCVLRSNHLAMKQLYRVL